MVNDFSSQETGTYRNALFLSAIGVRATAITIKPSAINYFSTLFSSIIDSA